MNILHIAYYTMLRNIRDWKYLVLLIAAPLLTILITGVATDSIESRMKLEKVKMIYMNEDEGYTAKAFDTFLEDEHIKDSFIIEKSSDYYKSIDKVKKGKVEAFVYIYKGFSTELSEGKNASVALYSNRSMSPTKLMVQSFINSVNTLKVTAELDLSFHETSIPQGVRHNPVSATGIAPSGLDKWTYLNMLIYLFYGAIISGFSITNEIKKKTIVRINCTPTFPLTNILGKISGHVVTLFGCTLLIILATDKFFGSNWNGNIHYIILSFLLYCIVSVCFGVITGLIFRKSGITILIIMCVNILLFNGSGMGWGEGGSGFADLSLISPHYHAAQALINNIFNGPMVKVQASVTALSIMAASLMILSLILGRRKTV